MSAITTSPLNNSILPVPQGAIATPASSITSPSLSTTNINNKINQQNQNQNQNQNQSQSQSQPPQQTEANSTYNQPIGERTKKEVDDSLRLIEDLKFFLATAPANWQENQVIRRYYLNHDEGFVSCVFWNNLYFVTGTDIVRCIVYKFEHFGRKIIDRKKFEEGIFSDLRNLKCNIDAILEPPRSEFLEFLFKNSCLRTQKKQKVFFWFNVPHDKLMADALERDLKKEKAGQKPTTIAHKEPALSFNFDESSNLYNQLVKHMDTTKNLLEVYESDEENNTFMSNYKIKDEYSNNSGFGNQLSSINNVGNNNKLNEIQSNKSFDKSSKISDNEDDDGDSGANDVSSGEDNNTTTNITTNNEDRTNNNANNSDYEDDFPLDYFEPHSSDDYITLESTNYQGNEYSNMINDNYEQLFENQIFQQPITNQVASNTEYLIEQTQPLKTPLPPISAIPPPKSSATTKFFQSNAEYYNQLQQQHTNQPIPPLSAKLQTSFNKMGNNNKNTLPPPPMHLPSQNSLYPENLQFQNPNFYPQQQQQQAQQFPPGNYPQQENGQYYSQYSIQHPQQAHPTYFDPNYQAPYYPNSQQQYPQQPPSFTHNNGNGNGKSHQQSPSINQQQQFSSISNQQSPSISKLSTTKPKQTSSSTTPLSNNNKSKLPLAAQHPAMTKQQAVSTKMQNKKKQLAAAAAASNQKPRGRGRPPNVNKLKSGTSVSGGSGIDKDKKYKVSIQDVIGAKPTKIVDKK
ncbi:STE12 [Candida pseudojiufengensis]|uniref:STE12 n=1 Tax=Candida pseudojiufengensis TaxID=497109 RepID=UPI002224F184|nr:STE12 [Candida pseudojiufengensis]KAI5960591.1 STE12 [Candida pseudojiufengensis]